MISELAIFLSIPRAQESATQNFGKNKTIEANYGGRDVTRLESIVWLNKKQSLDYGSTSNESLCISFSGKERKEQDVCAPCPAQTGGAQEGAKSRQKENWQDKPAGSRPGSCGDGVDQNDQILQRQNNQ